MCGLDVGENYYKSKKENPVVKQCRRGRGSRGAGILWGVL